MVNKDNIYILTRIELKNSSADKFKEGDVVICNGYFIEIEYGVYDIPGLLTKVTTRYDMRYLPIHKQPYYIQDFIHRRDIREVTP